MKITKREKVFVVVLAIIVTLALYYSLFYKNIRQEIRTLENDIEKTLGDLEDAPYHEKNIRNLERDVRGIHKEAGDVSLSNDENEVQPEIIVFLEDSTKDLGMSTRIKIGEIEKEKEYCTIPLIISLETNYDNLKDILKNIENAPWPLIIQDVKASKVKKVLADPALNWQVELFVRFIVFSQENIIENLK